MEDCKIDCGVEEMMLAMREEALFLVALRDEKKERNFAKILASGRFEELTKIDEASVVVGAFPDHIKMVWRGVVRTSEIHSPHAMN